MSFEIRFPPQPRTDAAGEFVEVVVTSPERANEPSPDPPHADRVQDYERVYAVPGLYEEIVQRRLGCRTPARMAALLAGAAARIGWEPAAVRILDAGAGNGVSGEAFAAQGMRPVVGLDILPAARDAALRDRPGVYDAYLAADLCALTPAEEQAHPRRRAQRAGLRRLGRRRAPARGGRRGGAGAARPGRPRGVRVRRRAGPRIRWRDLLRDAEQLARERALHRRTVTGGERHWEAVVVRLARR